ncbi:chalcone isomerase family protein [Rhodoferax sp.]|uniref:chalcone isomerase family protein n=1 Tax=Rhodoferax sp. TaxID=50421 RepID=UPI00374DE551
MPTEVAAALPSASFSGSARLSVWGFEVYDAQLWVAPGFQSARYADSAFVLELRYLRDFSRSDIARRSLVEMRRNASIPELQASAWQHLLEQAIPDVKKGDRITGIYQPQTRSARFLTNGRPTGEISDGDFARLFFGIWLSPQTSEPAMRKALLASNP